MNKETWATLVRTLLTSIGAFLIGKTLFGDPIVSGTIDVLVGAGMSLFSIVWGIVTKEIGIEMIQSAIRQILISVGGLLVAANKISAEKIEAVSGILLVVSTLLYSVLSRKKSDAIVSGKLNTEKLWQSKS